jgi:hypothetical protein
MQIPYPNNISKKSISTPTDDQLNEKRFTIIVLSNPSLANTSQQIPITNKEDNCSTIIPSKDANKSSDCKYIYEPQVSFV